MRWTALVVGLATVTCGSFATAQAAPRQAAAAVAASTAPASASAPSRVSARAQGAYVAVVREGSKRYLRVVSRSTGKVLQNVATGRVVDDGEPFLDVDLAPDGSVWAVVSDPRLPFPYQTRLTHYVGKRVVKSLPYVTSVRVSPDNTRLAISVLSPDGDKDGKGLAALRIAKTSGKVVSTLSSTPFPVDKAGWPTVEIGGMHVNGWLNAKELVVRDGCCDSAGISVVSAVKPSRQSTWPTFGGTGSTMALGTKGSQVLVARSKEAGDGSEQHPYYSAGIDAYWMTKRNPNGKLFTSVKGEDLDVTRYADSFVRKAGANPLWISPKRFPYRGAGTVVAAYV